jgi:hypothetical protein
MTLGQPALRTRLLRIARHVFIGVAAALAAAALHLAIVWFSRDVLGRFSWLWASRDVWWMFPLGYLALYAALAIPLGVLAALRRHDFGSGVTTFVWATFVLFSVALRFPRVHTLASLALALGLGVQIARLAARHPDGARRVVTRAGVSLGLGFAVLAAGVTGKRALDTRLAPSQPTIRAEQRA